MVNSGDIKQDNETLMQKLFLNTYAQIAYAYFEIDSWNHSVAITDEKSKRGEKKNIKIYQQNN